MCGCQLSWCGCLICPILFSNCDGVGGIRNISLLDINVAFRIVLDVGLMLVVFLFALFGCLLFTLLGCLELVVGSLLFQPRRRHPKYLSAWHSVALRRRYYSRCSQTPPPTMLYLSHFFSHPFSGNFMFFCRKKTYSCCHLPLLTLFHRSHFFLTPSISLFGHQLRGRCFELKMSILRLVFPTKDLIFNF